MKKINSILLATFVLLLVNTYGQKKEQEKITKTYFDIMVNMVRTSINYGASNTSVAEYKRSTGGIQAGVSLQAGITPFFSLVPELYYIRKGGKLQAGNSITNTDMTLRVNTIEFPVMARFHAGSIYINAGPSVAYNMSGHINTNEYSTKILFNREGEGFRRWEAGLQAGGGIEFPVKQKRIALDIRYNHGFTNISTDRQMFNRALMISIHFSKAWKKNPLAKK